MKFNFLASQRMASRMSHLHTTSSCSFSTRFVASYSKTMLETLRENESKNVAFSPLVYNKSLEAALVSYVRGTFVIIIR